MTTEIPFLGYFASPSNILSKIRSNRFSWRILRIAYGLSPSQFFFRFWIKSLEHRCVYLTNKNNFTDIQSIAWESTTVSCQKVKYTWMMYRVFWLLIPQDHYYLDCARIYVILFGIFCLYRYLLNIKSHVKSFREFDCAI